MDRLETPVRPNPAEADTAPEKPAMTIAAVRQTLLELRKHARRHDREDLTACLTLAISLATAHPRD